MRRVYPIYDLPKGASPMKMVQIALANWRDECDFVLYHPDRGFLTLEEVKYFVVDPAVLLDPYKLIGMHEIRDRIIEVLQVNPDLDDEEVANLVGATVVRVSNEIEEMIEGGTLEGGHREQKEE